MGIQVTELTQGKDPWKKEFIDFEFDGRKVSEFGLVVAFGGDRLALPAFPEFEDETSDINGATGQLYWGTRFKTLKRTFNLVTDGMTEEQLRDFRVHFSPGKSGKFVEPHLLGRYSYCRVSEVQNFELIPFKKDITFLERTFTTNEYKGEINITLCWDKPIFYAEDNYIDLDNSKNPEQDIRKIYVNGIPTKTSFSGLHLGKDKPKTYAGYIGGGLWTEDSKITTSHKTSEIQFPYYNPSTYPKEPDITIKINLSQTISNQDANKQYPKYYYLTRDLVNKQDFGKISLSSQAKLVNNTITTEDLIWNNAFSFTSPNVVFSVNKAIEIAYSYTGTALGEFETMLQTEISHEKVLTWAIRGLADIGSEEGGFKEKNDSGVKIDWRKEFNKHMLGFFNTSELLTILFNGEKMETIVTYTGKNAKGNFEYQEEKSGNVACSPYLKLVGGDSLGNDGKIKSCHFMKIENVSGFSSISLNYEYCYI